MNDARIERVARALCSVDGLDPDRPGAPRRVSVGAEEREVATSTWQSYEKDAKRFIAALDAATGQAS
jgi:hypothetical protein